MVNCLSKCKQCFKAVLATFVIFNSVWAEDIEIFFSQASNQEVQPNVLFILDGSGSMGEYDGTSQTRLERLRNSLTTVLENTTDINAGLMRFSHSQSGGSIIYPVRPIDQQLCNGQPCDDDTIFSAQSQVSSSSDDAVEAGNGSVSLADAQLTLMSIPGIPTGASWVGMRFPKLNIPQGATITDARLAFTSPGDYDSYTNLTIFAQDTEDAQTFDDNFNSVSSRSRTNNSVAWNAVPAWYDDNTYESPNLAPLVQQLVNKTNWCGGNAIALMVNGTGARVASAFDSGSADGPVLRVEYRLTDIPASGGCSTTTVIAQVEEDNDDAMQRSSNRSNGRMLRSYADLIMRDRPPFSQGFETGILLRDVAVPKDAVIIEANLKATIGRSQFNSGSLTVNLSMENTGNASAIGNNNYNLSNRNTLSPAVTWTDMPSTANTDVVSPSLTNMVQNIVNRSDWEEGNNMMLIAEPGTGTGQRSFLSHNASNANAPALEITFASNIRTVSDQINGPVTDVRSEIVQVLNDMLPEGGTPTVGALLEARRYFEGEPVDYGKFRYYNSYYMGYPWYWGKYGRISHQESYTGGNPIRSTRCLTSVLNGRYCSTEQIVGPATYISPVENECQANHIVLLTDGEPTVDPPAIADVMALTGGTCDPQEHDEGTCGEELAEFLRNGDNNVMIHTIGFNFTTQWLKDVARAGGGGYYTADTASQLSGALTNIINGVQDVNTTFVAPGVTVDRFSRLTHRNDLYLALFQPESTPRWAGNMKRYTLNGNPITLQDANGVDAMDGTGNFKHSAQSFWPDAAHGPDGNDVRQGGAAHQLDHNIRNVYTNIGGNDLTSTTNAFRLENTDLTSTHFGLSANDAQKRDTLIQWARGVDVDDEDGDDLYNDTRPHIGDPLHSQPQIVTYDGPSDSPVSVIFMSTNEGFLHAIDRDDGEEIFSFIPKELLSNLEIFYDNNPADRKPYGLDGPMSVWTQDNNNNGIIESGDHVYLYAGMRRGGNNYYALDVSDKNNPKVLFQITGGSGEFGELGQSWSKPVVAKIKYLGGTRDVLIIAGGYDEGQDNNSTREIDSVGRVVYIVDAATGEKLWSGGHADATPSKTFSAMNYSIPSSVKTIDGDGDGIVDQFYTGDMGGQVWRFDIDPEASSKAGLISGGVIAELSTDGKAESNRRFYHAPDITFTLKDGKYELNIGIGSGYQAHPLNRVIDDSFYLIRYPYELNADKGYGLLDTSANTPSYKALTDGDLFDATSNVLGQGSESEKAIARGELAASSGWYLIMERGGEKILGSSLTLNNVIMFTSYVPSASSTGCQPQLGTGVFWAVNLWDATPIGNLDGQGDEHNLTKSDRNKYVPGSGLPAAVQTYFVETTTTDDDGNINKTLGVATSSGPHVMLVHDPGGLTDRIYWSEYPDF